MVREGKDTMKWRKSKVCGEGSTLADDVVLGCVGLDAPRSQWRARWGVGRRDRPREEEYVMFPAGG